MVKKFISKSVTETVSFGKKLGRLLRGNDIVALNGELGSGKTVLTKGIAAGLGVKRVNSVNSPSFVILKEHKGRIPLYHFDIYRLKDISEFSTVGCSEYFYEKGVSVIEWADKIEEALPKNILRIDITISGRDERRFCVTAYGGRYKRLLERFYESVRH